MRIVIRLAYGWTDHEHVLSWVMYGHTDVVGYLASIEYLVSIVE